MSEPNVLKEKDYHSAEDSYKIFLQWTQTQGFDPLEVIRDIVNVMDKKMPKKNTVCFIGPPNSGKTLMITTPISYIMRFPGRMTSVGSDSAFMFQDFVNANVGIIDECVFNPTTHESMKLLMGGEDLACNVKFSGHSLIHRTPIIMTGNTDPWTLQYSSKEAFLARMFYYKTREDPDLKHVKMMNPKMWWYLYQQYDRDVLLPIEFMKKMPPSAEIENLQIEDEEISVPLE